MINCNTTHFLTNWHSFAEATARLEQHCSRRAMTDLTRAWDFACAAHQGQQRPAGSAYATHLLETIEVLTHLNSVEPLTLLIAILHDVAEDTSFTLGDIRNQFGPLVADGCAWLTIPTVAEAQRVPVRLAHFRQLRAAPRHVQQVKLAERYTSVQRLHSQTLPHKQARRYNETLFAIAPLARSFPAFAQLYAQWASTFASVNDPARRELAAINQLRQRWGRPPHGAAPQCSVLLDYVRATGRSDEAQRAAWQLSHAAWRWLAQQPLPRPTDDYQAVCDLVDIAHPRRRDQCLSDLLTAFMAVSVMHQGDDR